jgi:putative CocE/NonD family hydrolase
MKIILNNRNPLNSIVLVALIAILLVNCHSFKENSSIETRMIPVRDGILLATDLYFPNEKSTSYPVVLIRTPYNKDLLKDYGEYYSNRGYVTAIQDVRGKFSSEGDWIPYKSEGKDGYDVIEWLAIQKWSNGKVGMVGGSYSGSVQMAAAIEQPPHLTTIIPNITPATPYNNTPYENGVFTLGSNFRWTDIVSGDISGKEMNTKFQEVFRKNWYNELNYLPVISLENKFSIKNVGFWSDWIKNEPGASYFESIDYLKNIDNIEIPVFIQSGWFDVANRGAKLLYRELNSNGNKSTKLIMGPWVHSDRSSNQLGQMYLGEDAGLDLFELYTKWFDYWLKGVDNGILDEPMIQLFNIGPNKWVYADNYPIKTSKKTKLYLSSSSNSKNSEKGKLDEIESLSTEGETSYIYDPSNPTPGFPEFMKKNRFSEYRAMVDKRNDIIIFESESLKDSLTIAGPISAVIYASSTALDTDFNVTLTALDERGEIFPIGQTFGIIRAKYRNSLRDPELLNKNEIYKYTIDLSHTFYTLSPGQKLRLEISSCSFPDFSRNLNTGDNSQITLDYVVAGQKIHHNIKYPSHLVFYKTIH